MKPIIKELLILAIGLAIGATMVYLAVRQSSPPSRFTFVAGGQGLILHRCDRMTGQVTVLIPDGHDTQFHWQSVPDKTR